MEQTNSLDELSSACWQYIEKKKLNAKIRCTPSHIRMWKIDRDIQYYEKTLSFEIRKHIAEKLASAPPNEKIVVLDIGCGKGLFLRQASRINRYNSFIAGYSISNILFEGYYDKNKIIIGDISSTHYNRLDTQYFVPRLPYVLPNIADNSADLIVSVFALQYLKAKDIVKAINHTYRILKSDGLALLHIDTTFTEGDFDKEYKKNIDLSTPSFTSSPYTNKVQIVKIDKSV